MTSTFKRPVPILKELLKSELYDFKVFTISYFHNLMFISIASALSTKLKPTNHKMENSKINQNKKTTKNNQNSWGTHFSLEKYFSTSFMDPAP